MAVVDVLTTYNKKHPTDNVIKKWAEDIIEGARKVYVLHGVEVCPAISLGRHTCILYAKCFFAQPPKDTAVASIGKRKVSDIIEISDNEGRDGSGSHSGSEEEDTRGPKIVNVCSQLHQI